MFKKLPEFVPEIFLANAFLNYCLFAECGGTDVGWSADIDYTLQDRAAGVQQGMPHADTILANLGYRRKA